VDGKDSGVVHGAQTCKLVFGVRGTPFPPLDASGDSSVHAPQDTGVFRGRPPCFSGANTKAFRDELRGVGDKFLEVEGEGIIYLGFS
jgi:hypothetical protein